MKIYLAGPLFTLPEITFNAALAAALRNRGHEVWLPQEQEQRSKSAKEIFLKDVEGIDWAEAVVACMDGPDPDSGTCWECGYAYAKAMPTILFRTDFREIGDGGKAPFNLMLSESASWHAELPFTSLEELAGKLDAALRETAPAAPATPTASR